MAQAHIKKYWLIVGSVHILVAEVGSVRPELSGDLAIEAGRLKHAGCALGGMANYQSLVKPFKFGNDIYRVGRENGFPDSGQVVGSEQVMIAGKAYLQSGDGVRSRIHSKVEGLVVLIIHYVLNGLLVKGRAGGASVSYFGNIVEPQRA